MSEKKPVGLVSKLAYQVAIGYANLVEESKDFQGKGIIDRHWLSVIAIKAKHFASLAQFLRGQFDTEKGDYGAGVVRLGMAVNLAKEAETLAKNFNFSYIAPTQTVSALGTVLGATPPGGLTLPTDCASSLLEITKAHLAVVQEAKKNAERDNDLVYHDVPPSESSLPAIESLPQPIAKPITIQEIYAQQEVSSLIGPDIFKRLIPLEVHEQASVYSEEKAKLIRAESERCEASEGEIRVALDDLKIGEKVHRYSIILDGEGGPSSGPTKEVLGWADEIRKLEKDRDGKIEDMMSHLEEKRKSVEDDLASITRDLDEENRECEKMRVKYGHLWGQPPAGQFTRQYRDDIKNHQESLASAETSNRTIYALWKDVQGDIDILRGGRDSVYRAYASAVSGKGNAVNLLDTDINQDDLAPEEKQDVETAIQELEEKMGRLAHIRQERDEVLKDFKEKIQADDVSSLLLLNRRTQGVQPTLFQTELEKFKPYQSRISAAIAGQSQIIHEMSAIIKSTESRRGIRDAQRRLLDTENATNEIESRFRKAWQSFEDVRSGLKKGLGFYEQVETLVNNLRRDVRGFTNTRATERTRMASDAEARSRISSPASPSNTTNLPNTRGLESQFSSMGFANKPPQTMSPPPAVSSPYSMPPAASSHYPAPPTPSTTSPYPAPPQARSPPAASSPYDFSSLGNLPSAFSSQPSNPSYSSPPQPPASHQYSSQPSSQTYGSYPAPPAKSPYAQPMPPPPSSSPFPPPPPSRPSYPSYTAPPPGSYGAPSYGAPPPHPQQHQYQGSPSGGSLSNPPPPGRQDSYPSAYPPSTGVGASSPLPYPAPPPNPYQNYGSYGRQ